MVDISKPIPKLDDHKKIFLLWLGDEPMSPYRQNACNNMTPYTILITKKNINNYILPDYPLHASYEYLSTIHKSDYLRCYMLYHYGGGYSDIKIISLMWDKAFDELDK